MRLKGYAIRGCIVNVLLFRNFRNFRTFLALTFLANLRIIPFQDGRKEILNFVAFNGIRKMIEAFPDKLNISHSGKSTEGSISGKI